MPIPKFVKPLQELKERYDLTWRDIEAILRDPSVARALEEAARRRAVDRLTVWHSRIGIAGSKAVIELWTWTKKRGRRVKLEFTAQAEMVGDGVWRVCIQGARRRCTKAECRHCRTRRRLRDHLHKAAVEAALKVLHDQA